MTRDRLWQQADRLAGAMAKKDREQKFPLLLPHEAGRALLFEAERRVVHRQAFLEALREQVVH